MDLLKIPFVIATLCVTASGCVKGNEDVCADDPSRAGCSGDDGGRDAGGGDGGEDAGDVDAGPCGGACSGATPLCRESDGTCVACLMDSDCTDPAMARCDVTAGACAGCDDDGQCSAFASTPVCDEAGGSCAQCTVDSETTTCPAPDDFACHPTDLTCTGAERGSLGFCQPCVSDSECLTDAMGTLRCVPMTFGSPAMDHGTYCLLDLESYRAAIAMPAAPCPDRMVSIRTARSVGGVETMYCSIRENLSTCEAVLGFGDLCPGGDADCGAPGLDDASCQAGRCTYECTGAADCATGTCAGGATMYCQ